MSDNPTTPTHQIERDEITLKELIFKVKEYVVEIRRNWWILMLFIVPITGYMFYDAYTTKKTYKAELTFWVNDEGGSSLGLSAALGGLGDLADGGRSKLDKIIALSKSRRIIQTALLRTGEIDGITDYYINHVIRDMELHKKWEKDTTGLKGFLFNRKNIDNFTRVENSALLTIVDILIENKLFFTGYYDKKSEILKSTLITHNETLSINLLKSLYEDLSSYYVEKSTSKEERTYRMFRAKADSLKFLLRNKDISADRYEDKNRGSLFLEDKREVERMKKESYMYNVLYGETEKNMNIASFALESKVPYIQEIDMPITPIKPIKKSKFLALIIGLTMGIFIGSFVILLRMFFKNINSLS